MKDESGKAQDIRERSFQYALRAINLFRATQTRKDAAGRVLGKQFLRSATSIGANIEEAQSGESRADFIHKYGIAQKEARESLYWLRLIAESGIVTRRQMEPLIQETDELISVITAIIVRAKKNSGKSEGSSQKDEV
ncbi:MAG: four helix bundle protein [Terriglobia bacterium]